MAHKNGWSVSCATAMLDCLDVQSLTRTIMRPGRSVLDKTIAILQGIIINGCIRDSADIAKMPLGVKALNTYPLKSSKRDLGLRDVPVAFAGVIVTPQSWIYADKDGVIVAEQALKL